MKVNELKKSLGSAGLTNLGIEINPDAGAVCADAMCVTDTY